MSDLNDDFDADELMELADAWRPVSRESPRCGGSGEFVESLTPKLDHRDPDNVTREYECPGCPDCAAASIQEHPPA